MEDLEEWLFGFSVSAAEPIPYQAMEDMLILEAIPWAEQRRLEIGGGFRHGSGRLGGGKDRDRLWRFWFGLCIRDDDQLIPRPQAQELFDMIVAWCQVHGFSVNGSFREFPPEKVAPAN